jgi:hypothetical protein
VEHEAAGIKFIDNGCGPGVRLLAAKPKPKAPTNTAERAGRG